MGAVLPAGMPRRAVEHQDTSLLHKGRNGLPLWLGIELGKYLCFGFADTRRYSSPERPPSDGIDASPGVGPRDREELVVMMDLLRRGTGLEEDGPDCGY